MARELREHDATLVKKNRAIAEYDRAFQGVANVLTGLFLLAGQDDLADRVRPSSIAGPQSALTRGRLPGHTQGMKAAVSIPDDVFVEADRLAKQLNTSRSQLYSRALKEFLARHAPDQVTDAMNRVCDEVEGSDDFGRRAARRVLEKSEW